MISIKGYYYDGKSSKKAPASLEIFDDGIAKLLVDGAAKQTAFSQLRISSRIGNTPRSINFPDSGKFETDENDAVDAILAKHDMHRGARFIHILETKKHYILLALLVVIISSFALIRYGIPAMAKAAAFALPASTSGAIGKGALEIMDKTLFSKSELDDETREKISEYFAEIAKKQPQGFNYNLAFRKGIRVGTNAFALPSGTIVLTDELVKIVKDNGEIIAVLAHEFGHVAHRHSLRRLFQDSVIALIVVMVTGDLSSTSSLIAAMPTILVEAQYSQSFELEADNYALAYLQDNNIDPAHFKNLMLHLEEYHSANKNIPSFLSTHPPTAERIRLLENLKDSKTSTN
jgi:Zn-dependent protease with chaperone function